MAEAWIGPVMFFGILNFGIIVYFHFTSASMVKLTA